MSEHIPITDFQKVEMRVGEILAVEDHPNASKLLVLKVDLGEEQPRTIVAGLRGHYTADELTGKKAIFVANLQPANLRGIESNGMIMAASNPEHTKVVILEPEKEMPAGSKIS